MDAPDLWNRYRQHVCRVDSLDLTLDISRMHFDETFLASMEPAMQRAFTRYGRARSGRHRQPGRKTHGRPLLAARAEAGADQRHRAGNQRHCAIDQEICRRCARRQDQAARAARFTQVLAIGIGGSALGPMFVADALGNPAGDRMRIHFIDNTDPDGIARTLETLQGLLPETLCIVTSKSGGTPDTRNGMVVVAAAYRERRISISRGTPSPSPWPARTWTAGVLRKMARAFPDVRLGGRPHQRTVRRRSCCPPLCRGSTSTPCSPEPPPATRRRACTKRAAIPPR